MRIFINILFEAVWRSIRGRFPKQKWLIPLSKELARAKERYKADGATACRLASLQMIPHVGINFHISPWTSKCRTVYEQEWQDPQFDWPEIFRRHAEPDRLDIAIWAPDGRLVALALCLTTGRAVGVRFIEGNKFLGCPLKGFRAAIVLETAACYAQLRGKREVRIMPVNDSLRDFYVDLYGFEDVRPNGEQPYLRRIV